jgi:hypothetical protein
MKKAIFFGVFVACSAFLMSSVYGMHVAETKTLGSDSVYLAETVPISPSPALWREM